MLHICSLLVFIFCVISVYSVGAGSWLLSLGGPSLCLNRVSLLIDYTALVFGFAVRFVIFNVFVYARGYIKEESLRKYFFIPLSLFRARILLLIFAGDVSVLFLA